MRVLRAESRLGDLQGSLRNKLRLVEALLHTRASHRRAVDRIRVETGGRTVRTAPPAAHRG